jgi:hypothetical protein
MFLVFYSSRTSNFGMLLYTIEESHKWISGIVSSPDRIVSYAEVVE